jgi:pimeloyl-ACP methyl ester carboxylesterase
MDTQNLNSHLPSLMLSPAQQVNTLIEWANTDIQLADTGVLQKDCVSKVVMPTSGVIKTIVLLIHGFGAGPWVFEEWIRESLTEGLLQDTLIIAPRLPGSGFAKNGKPDPAYLPDSSHISRYATFVRRWVDILAVLGSDVRLGGHSFGGVLAYQISCQLPVQKILLIGPFFDTKHKVGKAIFETMSLLSTLTFLPVYRLLNPIPWRLKESFNTGALNLPGHSQMTLGQLYAVYTYAKSVTQALDVPKTSSVAIVASEADTRSSIRAIEKKVEWLNSTGKITALTFQKYPLSKQVPHAMIHSKQNKEAPVRAQLFEKFKELLQ